MTDQQQQGREQGRSIFDNMMFGGPVPQQQTISNNKVDTNNNNQQTIEQETEATKNEPSQPTQQVNFVEMMQQFDTFMGHVNKLGPSFKKMGPLLDLLKGFGGSDTKK